MTEQPEPPLYRLRDKSTCRHCTEEIIWEPWFNDNRGPNPPVWSHTRSGVKSCSSEPEGWKSDRWPFAEPVALDPLEPAANPLDSNPEALAWARSKVQQYIERLAEFQSTAQAQGDLITAMACGNARLMAELHFLGDGTRTIGAFDARLANEPQP